MQYPLVQLTMAQHTVTAEQEKAFLNYVLIGNLRWHDSSVDDYHHETIRALNCTSLAEIVRDDTMSFPRKVEIVVGVLDALRDILLDVPNEMSYVADPAEHFAKYKDNLFGAIAGLSLTANDWQKLYNNLDLSYQNSLFTTKSYFFATSLPYSFIAAIPNIKELFDEALQKWPLGEATDLVAYSLIFNTGLVSQVQYESIMSNIKHDCFPLTDLLVLSAYCPQTKDWVKKECFQYAAELVNAQADYESPMDYDLYRLEAAYQELFGASLLESIGYTVNSFENS